jgi:hyperosmotically inducible protein
MSGINVATTAAMTVSVVRMTGTIADRMEILTAAGVTRDRIGGDSGLGKKLIDRARKQTFQTSEEIFMIRTIKNVAGTLVVLFLISSCQAMTGETMGQNIDDGTLTSYVKTKLASDKIVSLTRVGVETNNGIVYLTGEVETGEQKSRSGSLAYEVKGVKQVVNNLQVIKR